MAIGMIIFEDTPDGGVSIQVHYDPVPQREDLATSAQIDAHDVFEWIQQQAKAQGAIQ